MQGFCKYFKEGYCSKGKYCEYSHDVNSSSSVIPCRYFASSGSCPFGKTCTFSHKKKSEYDNKKIVSSQTNIVRPQPITSLTKQKNDKLIHQQSEKIEQKITSNTINNLWDFRDDLVSGNDDGIYFYGAPGKMPQQLNEKPLKSFADIIGTENYCIEINDDRNKIHMNLKNENNSDIDFKQQICSFYLSGDCRYGNFCRHSHDLTSLHLSDFNENVNINVSTDNTCGICISEFPIDGYYGLLSHCDCVFCLKCIRDWRKEGIEVVKENQQVRKCPLCRIESYFVCPSKRILHGETKVVALDAYCASLKLKPCKYFQSGDCPFGSSCFYKHINPDGSEEVTAGPRILFNGNEAPVYRSEKVSLSEFINHQL